MLHWLDAGLIKKFRFCIVYPRWIFTDALPQTYKRFVGDDACHRPAGFVALQIIAFVTQSLVGHAYPTTMNAYSGVYHLPVKTSSLRRPAGCCLPAGLAVDSGKQRMLAKFQGSTCTICRKAAIALGYYFRQNCFPFPRRHVKLEAVKSHFLTPIRHTRKATRHGSDRSAVVQP